MNSWCLLFFKVDTCGAPPHQLMSNPAHQWCTVVWDRINSAPLRYILCDIVTEIPIEMLWRLLFVLVSATGPWAWRAAPSEWRQAVAREQGTGVSGVQCLRWELSPQQTVQPTTVAGTGEQSSAWRVRCISTALLWVLLWDTAFSPPGSPELSS